MDLNGVVAMRTAASSASSSSSSSECSPLTSLLGGHSSGMCSGVDGGEGGCGPPSHDMALLSAAANSGRRTSRVWKYFRMVDNCHYVCCLCNFVGAYTNTTNMRKHIQNHHPEIFQDILDHTRPSNRLQFLRSFQTGQTVFQSSSSSGSNTCSSSPATPHQQYQPQTFVSTTSSSSSTSSVGHSFPAPHHNSSSSTSTLSSTPLPHPGYVDANLDDPPLGAGDEREGASRPFAFPHSVSPFPLQRDHTPHLHHQYGATNTGHSPPNPPQIKSTFKSESKEETFVPTLGEDRKYDFGSLSSSSGGGAPFAPGLNENSTESGEGAAGGGGGGGGGGGACEEGPVPMSPEQFLCEDMEHAGGASPHTPSSSSHQRPESYKLRHNNHLTLVLESLAGDESFMDVTLTAQGKAIKAHKSVLSAVSPYFRSVLKENPCQHPIIIMPRDIRFEELNNIISYVYKGEMTVAAEDLSSMLKTAEVLQVTGLSPSEAGSGAGGIMSHMQGLPAGVFGAGAAPPAKAKKAKHVHTQQHQVVAHEEEPHAANNHDIRGRIDPLDFLNADMTCVKEEIPSDTEETEDMGFTLPDDSSGPASKVTEPLPAAASFSSDPSTTRHPSNRRKSLDSPRPMDDPSNKPFNPGEPGPSPTEPQAAAAATPSPSSTPPPPHVCPHCLETHRPTDALHSHLRLKHPSKPSFVCASCGKVFLRHSLFAEHSKKCKV